jgi:neutral amino acid transport system permease protein
MSEFLDAITGGLQAGLGYQAIFFVLLAVGLNVHFGYTGLLNFGQAGFALLGAFGVAVSVVRWDLPFWVGIVIGLAEVQ